jgi:hypothetical protein
MTIKPMLKVCSVAALVLLAFIALGPANWTPRSGLGWEIDHFVGYFVFTLMFCLAWPRPLVVAGALVAFASLLEALQGITPEIAIRIFLRPCTAQLGCWRRLCLLIFSSEHGGGFKVGGRKHIIFDGYCLRFKIAKARRNFLLWSLNGIAHIDVGP